MVDEKQWWGSKTIWGNIIAFVAILLGLVGWKVDAATQAVIVDQAVAVSSAAVGAAGVLLSLYGRWSATRRIAAKADE